MKKKQLQRERMLWFFLHDAIAHPAMALVNTFGLFKQYERDIAHFHDRVLTVLDDIEKEMNYQPPKRKKRK